MEHIAKTFEHIVLKVEPWELIDLAPSWHIATIQPFDIYTDRDEAINAIKKEYPDFEPPEWEQPTKTSEQLRKEAYREESDPLFFKAQRGEIEMQVWLEKVAEIKQRY